jgi:glycine/D-amino acid oxidase-like deaminating enzyme
MPAAPVSRHGLWEATAPPAPETAPLQAQGVAVDIAIVGAGYSGLSAALHAAEAGARVAVLEAQHVGFGGSGRNVGLVNAGMWVMPDALPRELGATHGQRLLDALGEGPSLVYGLIERLDLTCEAVRRGTLHCAVGASGLRNLRERHRQWQARGAPVELLDAAAIADATGSRAYTGGLLDRRAGTIQPLAYARGLAHAAVRAGAALHTHSPVTAVHDHHSHWTLHTPHGSVNAAWVIVATNAYTDRLWPVLQEALVRFPYFNLATAPLPAAVRARILPGLQGAWDTPDVLSSFRLDAQGRLVFGSVGALRGPGTAVHGDWGRRALARLFPALGRVAFEHAWYGQIGMTANALPRLHLLARNTVSISGYNGRGIAPGTVFGRALARLALGQCGLADLPLPVSEPAPAAFKALREMGYEAGALLVHAAQARF